MNIISAPLRQRGAYILGQIMTLIKNSILMLFGRMDPSGIRTNFQNLIYGMSILDPRLLPFEISQGTGIRYLRGLVPEAEATIATSYETALPARLTGSGKRHYFMQHYEPYFSNESPDPELARITALQSYSLGLSMIANSTWLHDKISVETGAHNIKLCLNAIDHRTFTGKPRIAVDAKAITIISYGGRNAEWKGFREMAQAVSIARNRLADRNISWRVYGDALLPPDNDIASYESLGFLEPVKLAAAYRDADMLLSASWYESFPLFPLEAMACGLPVITTQYGTEDYAFHEETAHIVEAKSPENIAEGIIRLIEDAGYRTRLAENGHGISRNFTWEKSVETMESLLISDSPRS